MHHDGKYIASWKGSSTAVLLWPSAVACSCRKVHRQRRGHCGSVSRGRAPGGSPEGSLRAGRLCLRPCPGGLPPSPAFTLTALISLSPDCYPQSLPKFGSIKKCSIRGPRVCRQACGLCLRPHSVLNQLAGSECLLMWQVGPQLHRAPSDES